MRAALIAIALQMGAMLGMILLAALLGWVAARRDA